MNESCFAGFVRGETLPHTEQLLFIIKKGSQRVTSHMNESCPAGFVRGGLGGKRGSQLGRCVRPYYVQNNFSAY